MKGFRFKGWIQPKSINNIAYDVYIATPKGWKCIKKNCKAKFKHVHLTYSCLLKK